MSIRSQLKPAAVAAMSMLFCLAARAADVIGVLDLPGDAPNAVPEPGTWALLAIAAAAAVAVSRKKRK